MPCLLKRPSVWSRKRLCNAGSLPAGLILDPSTGAITGTPTVDGSFNFTITATDAALCSGSQAYSMIAYGLSFYDDSGRSQFCVSTTTGAFQYAILSGSGSPATYSGTVQVLNGKTLFRSLPGALNVIYVTYDPYQFRARGYLSRGNIYSQLVDMNTKNDPTCGQGGPD